MIDNWGLSTCAHKLSCLPDKSYDEPYNYLCEQTRQSKKTIDLCWQNFITSIVLWDTVYTTLARGYSFSMYEYEGMEILKKYIEKEDVFQSKSLSENVFFPQSKYIKLKRAWEARTNHNNCCDNDLIFRGYIYALQAQYLGCNYLPHPIRAQELKSSNLFNYPLDASFFTKIIDKEVYSFIDAINKENDGEVPNLRFPLLYEYINRNAKSPEEEICLALELRNLSSVKKFRKSIDGIDKALKKRNILDLKIAIEQITQMCKDIENQIYKKPKSFIVTLGFTPKLIMPELTFSFQHNEPDIMQKILKTKKLHTTFLYDLATFGYTGKDNFSKKCEIKRYLNNKK